MKKKLLKGLALGSMLVLFATSPGCSILKSKKKKKAAEIEAQKNVEKEKEKKEKEDKIKDFKDVIKDKDTLSQNGLFNIYYAKNKYYFEIPDSLLQRDLLITTRIDQAPFGLKNSNAQYGGEKIDETMWRFNKNLRAKRLEVIIPNTYIKADSTAPMYQSVMNSNMANIATTFPIACYNKNQSGVLIDVTSYLDGDKSPFTLSQKIKEAAKISGFDDKRSQLDTIIAYKNNIEVSSIKTYGKVQDFEDGATFKIHSSILLLPKTPMKARINDERIGYFGQRVLDYDNNPQGVDQYGYVHRWRLEPKDTAAYMRGELVEPIKPIVIYIDPATPKEWVPYLIKGIDDWQVAFENAGFKNAIFGKVAPSKEENPEFDLNDSRYSVIRYFASDIQNAYGPHTSDPRTGEIIETHIGWYHNVMQLIKDWFRTQTAAVNTDARPERLSTEQMGQLIRFVSSHEVGHTLGLAHNFGSSYAYSVSQLRNKTFTDEHGTAPSIMDYARFNYIAQPGDGVTNIYPKIGTYDKWAIKWAYSWFPENHSVKEEKEILDQWMLSHAGDPEYFYGRQGEDLDPRDQSEDLSDDAVEAGKLGVANLKRILPNLIEWTQIKGEKYDKNLVTAYDNVVTQLGRYSGHVNRQIASARKNILVYGQNGNSIEYTDKNTQREAVDFLVSQVFVTPDWLVNNKAINAKLPYHHAQNLFSRLQISVLMTALSPVKLENMANNYAQDPKNYNPTEYLTDLEKGVFTGAGQNANARNLQSVFVNTLISIAKSNNEAGAIAYAKLTSLRSKLSARKGSSLQAAHAQKLANTIKNFMEGKSEGNSLPMFPMPNRRSMESSVAPSTLDCFSNDDFSFLFDHQN